MIKKVKNCVSQGRRAIPGCFGMASGETAKFLSENAIFYNSVIFKEKYDVCVHDEQNGQDKLCIFTDLIG